MPTITGFEFITYKEEAVRSLKQTVERFCEPIKHDLVGEPSEIDWTKLTMREISALIEALNSYRFKFHRTNN
jgi:hypothetical protein